MTLDEYLEKYVPEGVIAEVTPEPTVEAWPTILVRRGNNALVLHLCALDGDSPHVFVDARAFIDGEEARTGVFGMEDGRQYSLRADWDAVHGSFPPHTSHGWPATKGVTLLAGEQG